MSKLKFVVVLIVTMMGLGACGSAKDSAAGYIDSGKELLADGKAEKARLEFKNALQIDPKAAEAYYQLALLDEKAKKWKAMFANLTRVEALDPKHYEAILKLGQLYVLSGDTTLALEQANKVFKDKPDHLGALILKSSALFKQEKYAEAMTEVDKALTIEPSNIEANSLKAIALNKLGQPNEALVILTKISKDKPNDLSLIMLKLAVLEQQKEYDKMESIYEELMVKKPTEKWIYVSLAKLYNNQGNYLDAKKVLERFVTSQPDSQEAKILLVGFIQDKEPDEALSLLNDYIELNKENFDLRFSKVHLLLVANRNDEAIIELERIIELDKKEGEHANKANVMLANFDMQSNDQKSALDKINGVLEKAPENEAALLTLAKIELQNKNVDSAVTHLRVVLRNNPESEKALVLLAQAYLNSGSEELAEDSFRQALSLNPGNTTAALSVSKSLIQSDNLDRAELVLTKALKQQPNDNELLQALAQVKFLKKDWLGTKSIADSFLKDDKNSVQGLYLSARLLQAQEQYAEAIEAYKKVLEINPELSRALQGVAFSSMKLNQKSELLAFLKDFNGKNPKQLTGYSIQSNLYVRDKQFAKAEAILNEGLSIEPKWLAGYSALASVYLGQKDTDKAENTYKSGLSVSPKSNGLSMQLASLYEQKGEFSEAKNIYEQVLERNSDIEPAINNLASLLTDQFRSEENLKKAAIMTERFKSSTQPYYLDTYAWVLVQQGQLDIAQPILERVVSLSPNVAVFNYHLGVLFLERKNPVEAQRYLNVAKELANKQGDELMIEKISEQLASIK